MKKARMEGQYDAFAREYDQWDASHRSLGGRRRELVGGLRGTILEVGVGTGLNLPFYRNGADVTACDISTGMLNRAARLNAQRRHRVKLAKLDAHKLPFLSGTFDRVVGTFFFCSVDNPGRVAREIRRVLKPAGRLVTLGYHSDRVVQVLRRAGFRIVSAHQWPGGERPIGRITAAKTT